MHVHVTMSVWWVKGGSPISEYIHVHVINIPSNCLSYNNWMMNKNIINFTNQCMQYKSNLYKKLSKTLKYDKNYTITFPNDFIYLWLLFLWIFFLWLFFLWLFFLPKLWLYFLWLFFLWLFFRLPTVATWKQVIWFASPYIFCDTDSI